MEAEFRFENSQRSSPVTRGVRLRDIGSRLNLSESTVSRALAGNLLISPETRMLVQKTALAMGYVAPSHGAKKRRVGSRTVGVMVSADDLQDGFMTQLLKCIHREMLQLGYHVMLLLDAMNAANDAAHLATFRPLVDGYLDGMILCSATTDSLILRELRRLGMPTVLAAQSAVGSQMDTVEADNLLAASEVAKHFHETGHRRIGLIVGATGSSISRDRVRGAIHYMHSVGALESAVVVAWDATTFEDGYSRAYQMLSDSNRVTAILAGSDAVAMGVLEAARTRHISVPHDLSVAGFEGSLPLSSHRIGLTTVSSPITEIARTACRRMVERIRNGGLTPPAYDIVATRLVFRNSSVPQSRDCA